MTILFISDLHLTPERIRTNELFFDFLSSIDKNDSLYILGDLFEFWIGDDAAEITGHAGVVSALRKLTKSGVNVYFMPGNRDFLVGDGFASATGCQLLSDPAQITLGDKKISLMHGDSMCTDDTEHQQFRSLVNNPDWQKEFLNYSIEKRRELALSARSQSDLHKAMTSMEIMDVNQGSVEQEINRHNADVLIHGHTHRPGIHKIYANGKEVKRIVLGDWYEQSSVLRYEQGRFLLSANGADIQPV